MIGASARLGPVLAATIPRTERLSRAAVRGSETQVIKGQYATRIVDCLAPRPPTDQLIPHDSPCPLRVSPIVPHLDLSFFHEFVFASLFLCLAPRPPTDQLIPHDSPCPLRVSPIVPQLDLSFFHEFVFASLFLFAVLGQLH